MQVNVAAQVTQGPVGQQNLTSDPNPNRPAKPTKPTNHKNFNPQIRYSADPGTEGSGIPRASSLADPRSYLLQKTEAIAQSEVSNPNALTD